MSQLQDIQQFIIHNLRILDFEKYTRKCKEAKDISAEDLFTKANQKAFEVIIMFIVKRLKNSQILQQYRYCYPCLDKTQESEFRKITIDYLKSLEKVNPTLKFLPIYAHQPSGEAFCNYLLHLTNYILVKEIEDQLGQNFDLNLNSFQLIEFAEEEEAKRDEKQHILQEKADNFSKCFDYFESRKEDLEAKLDNVCSSFDQRLDDVQHLDSCLNHSLGDVNNVLRTVLEKSDIVNQKWIQINDLIERIRPKIDLYNNLCDASLFSTSNQILDLRQFFQDPQFGKYHRSNGCIDFKLLHRDVEDFVSRYSNKLSEWGTQDECDRLLANMVFLREEFDKTMNNIKEIFAKLGTKKIAFRELTSTMRKDLLNTEKVQKRREWFASKIPSNPPKIKFFFGGSKSSAQDSCQSDCFMSPPANGFTPPNQDLKKCFNRKSIFDLSFHPMDISRLSYIPPHAPERPFLSPLREESSILSLSDGESLIHISNGSL